MNGGIRRNLHYRKIEMSELLKGNLKYVGKIDNHKLRQLKFIYKNKAIFLHGYNFKDTYCAGRECYIEKEYDWLNVKDKVVLDIGAFTGDTSMAFALRKAKKIYAVEGNPKYISLIRYNAEFNKLNNIEPILALISNKEGFDKISIHDEMVMEKDMPDNYATEKFEAETTTLNKFIEKYSIPDGSALKMDIEGYEYKVIANASISNLKKFDSMIIDFHSHGHKKLTDKLKIAGFTFTIVDKSEGKGISGYIKAKRYLDDKKRD